MRAGQECFGVLTREWERRARHRAGDACPIVEAGRRELVEQRHRAVKLCRRDRGRGRICRRDGFGG